MKNLIFCSLAMMVLFIIHDRLIGDDADGLMPALACEKAMAGIAENAYQATVRAYQAGTIPSIEQIYIWSRRWMDSEVQLATNPVDRYAAYTDHRDRMKKLNAEAEAKSKAGVRGGEAEEVAASKYYFAESQLWLSNQIRKQ